MNLLLCLLAGAAVGWIAWSVLHLNAARGALISAVIGTIGGYFGGRILAPVFLNGADEVVGFNFLALLIASASAFVVIKTADMLYRHFQF